MDTAAAPTESALLQLLWLASPALPIGGFSYSEGLEAAIEAALVTTEADAGDCLMTVDVTVIIGVAIFRPDDGVATDVELLSRMLQN